ncbi:MAG: AAA family ATPase [Saprospiraceae bacterium]|nr:AAA family ATPase [Saprospiraceae bacterium]
MYIRQVEINHIRSISHFKMTFETPAGWHVLIGDNGAGKSSIIRSIALGLIGAIEIHGINPNWSEWLQWKAKEGSVLLSGEKTDKSGVKEVQSHLTIKREEDKEAFLISDNGDLSQKSDNGFSAGYGPFRRFTGGSFEKDKLFENPSYKRLASHLSLFSEDVALTEATKCLMSVQFQALEKKVKHSLLDDLKKLINSPDFLPHHSKLKSVGSEGVIFIDGNGAEISVTQMSDGYRSILSLTFELIRQLVRVFGEDAVFRQVRNGRMEIDMPGVVLIDEIDAHLHPSWQTRIGQWFTRYFPKIQFIVTTHSPLVCRAGANGSIWRLAAPGSDMESGEVTGADKNRLIYGNILDAYGTEVFGADVTINSDAVDKKEELVHLSKKKVAGKMSIKEQSKLEELRKTFSTDDIFEL